MWYYDTQSQHSYSILTFFASPTDAFLISHADGEDLDRCGTFDPIPTVPSDTIFRFRVYLYNPINLTPLDIQSCGWILSPWLNQSLESGKVNVNQMEGGTITIAGNGDGDGSIELSSLFVTLNVVPTSLISCTDGYVTIFQSVITSALSSLNSNIIQLTDSQIILREFEASEIVLDDSYLVSFAKSTGTIMNSLSVTKSTFLDMKTTLGLFSLESADCDVKESSFVSGDGTNNALFVAENFGELMIESCNFTNCHTVDSRGSAIFCDAAEGSELTLSNVVFTKCENAENTIATFGTLYLLSDSPGQELLFVNLSFSECSASKAQAFFLDTTDTVSLSFTWFRFDFFTTPEWFVVGDPSDSSSFYDMADIFRRSLSSVCVGDSTPTENAIDNPICGTVEIPCLTINYALNQLSPRGARMLLVSGDGNVQLGLVLSHVFVEGSSKQVLATRFVILDVSEENAVETTSYIKTSFVVNLSYLVIALQSSASGGRTIFAHMDGSLTFQSCTLAVPEGTRIWATFVQSAQDSLLVKNFTMNDLTFNNVPFQLNSTTIVEFEDVSVWNSSFTEPFLQKRKVDPTTSVTIAGCQFNMIQMNGSSNPLIELANVNVELDRTTFNNVSKMTAHTANPSSDFTQSDIELGIFFFQASNVSFENTNFSKNGPMSTEFPNVRWNVSNILADRVSTSEDSSLPETSSLSFWFSDEGHCTLTYIDPNNTNNVTFEDYAFFVPRLKEAVHSEIEENENGTETILTETGISHVLNITAHPSETSILCSFNESLISDTSVSWHIRLLYNPSHSFRSPSVRIVKYVPPSPMPTWVLSLIISLSIVLFLILAGVSALIIVCCLVRRGYCCQNNHVGTLTRALTTHQTSLIRSHVTKSFHQTQGNPQRVGSQLNNRSDVNFGHDLVRMPDGQPFVPPHQNHSATWKQQGWAYPQQRTQRQKQAFAAHEMEDLAALLPERNNDSEKELKWAFNLDSRSMGYPEVVFENDLDSIPFQPFTRTVIGVPILDKDDSL
ncbi:hypothetical protein BLNAU_13320 [Blattamonas nauphoetae]|uniref:Transmembrane protein n=1 Tax=Blattamonas nauphoetae TaxID=2049346 RepID=A0ABQ9XK34_9EUKA|nr:hypothetical protein BLNAU_13320 [Blattamonas nauphoetae]